MTSHNPTPDLDPRAAAIAGPAAGPAGARPDGNGAAPAGAEAFDGLSWLTDAWKRAVELKAWSGLAELVGLEEVFVAGHPEEVRALVRRLDELTEKLFDFEVLPVEVTKQEVDGERARFSLRVQVLWSSSEDWEDHRLDVDLHVGFRLRREGWSTSHLLVDYRASAPRPREAGRAEPEAAEPAPAGLSAGEKPLADAADANGDDRPLTDEMIAEAAAQYFARPEDKPPAPALEAAPVAQGRKRVVYFPVLLDADVVRDLLG